MIKKQKEPKEVPFALFGFLKQYVENRSQIINDVIALNSQYNVNADEVKVWFLKCFNGGDGSHHMLDCTVFMNDVIIMKSLFIIVVNFLFNYI